MKPLKHLVMPLVALVLAGLPAGSLSSAAELPADLVSMNHGGTGTGAGSSGYPSVSADGRFVAFHSEAADLVATDTNGAWDVFVRDMVTGITRLVSVNLAGTDSGRSDTDAPNSLSPIISADGRFVLFTSSASDLATADSNGASDVFLRDLFTETTELISVNFAGTDSGDGPSVGTQLPPNRNTQKMSADGRFVVFSSSATDLGARPVAGFQVYVRDRVTRTTELVSVNTAGTGGGNRGATAPAITADGRFVAFVSEASDLVATDGNGSSDVFARDLLARTTELVSVNLAGTDAGDGRSSGPVTSANGRFVAFISEASDLVLTDTNRHWDVFLRDLLRGTTEIVSVNLAGSDSGSSDDRPDSVDPALSADGRFVAFRSRATDLVAAPTLGGNDQLYVRNVRSRSTRLVSFGGATSARSHSISAGGRFVAFLTLGYVGDEWWDGVVVRDLRTGIVRRGGASSRHAVLSATGHVVAFESDSIDLAPGDTNGTTDVFVSRLGREAPPWFVRPGAPRDGAAVGGVAR